MRRAWQAGYLSVTFIPYVLSWSSFQVVIDFVDETFFNYEGDTLDSPLGTIPRGRGVVRFIGPTSFAKNWKTGRPGVVRTQWQERRLCQRYPLRYMQD